MFLISFERRGIVNTQPDIHQAVTFINALLDDGITVYQLTVPVLLRTARYPEGYIFPGGTIVYEGTISSDRLLIDCLAQEEFQANTTRFRVLVKPSSIAFYAGLNSADFCAKPYQKILQAFGFDFEELGDEDIRNGRLDDFELLIVPGGPDAGESYYQGLGSLGYDRIRRFISNGGRYLGSCAGSYLPLTSPKGTVEQRMWLNIVPAGDPKGLNYWRTGAGLVRVSLCGEGPLTFGLEYGIDSTLDVIYWEGPVFAGTEKGVKIVARYEEFIGSGSNPPFWDIGSNTSAFELTKWYNALSPERFEKYLKSMPAAICTEYGKGRLVLYSFHPEFGYPNCEFENDPVHLLISNAIYELFS